MEQDGDKAQDHGEAGHPAPAHGHGAAPTFDLGEEERLPWLESADDLDEEERRGGVRRFVVQGIVALIVLALLIDGVFWLTHRGGSSKPADGSLIEASKEPYKVAPSDPGGKKFAGTGDSSFKVSQGEHPDASIAGSAGTTPPPAAPMPAPSPVQSQSPGQSPNTGATPAPKSGPTPAGKAAGDGGVAVQVGAYSSGALAESGWSHLVAAHDLLKGVSHRVVEAKADIGTVYRLQAMSPDPASANSLCSRLQADGVKCQVKR